MSASDYLDTMAGNKWSSSLQSSAISLASAWSGVSAGESDKQDVGLAMLALQVLRSRDQSESGEFPSDFGGLVTEEIERLLFSDDADTKFRNVIRYNYPTRSWDAYDGGR